MCGIDFNRLLFCYPPPDTLDKRRFGFILVALADYSAPL